MSRIASFHSAFSSWLEAFLNLLERHPPYIEALGAYPYWDVDADLEGRHDERG